MQLIAARLSHHCHSSSPYDFHQQLPSFNTQIVRYKGGHCGICRHPGWLSPFFSSSCIPHLFTIFGLVMCILPFMALIPSLKPLMDSFPTHLSNLKTLFGSVPKELYSMSLFLNSAMWWMIFKIIWSIFLPDSSFLLPIHQISSKNCGQVAMSPNTCLFAGGHLSHASLSLTRLSNTISGPTSFDQPSTI